MITVQDIMSTTVFRVDGSTSIREAARLMADKSMGSLLVTQEHKITGIVTEADMVKRVLAYDLNPDTHSVEEIMSSPLVSVPCDTGLTEARDMMDKEDIRHLLVTVSDDISGIVSVRDIIRDPRQGN